MSCFTIMLETWTAHFSVAHVRKEGRATHFMQIVKWHKQPRSSTRSAEINFHNQSVWRKIHLCKMLAPSSSSLYCFKVSSCNLIPLCSCTTWCTEYTPPTSCHGLMRVGRKTRVGKKWATGQCSSLNMERASKASLQISKASGGCRSWRGITWSCDKQAAPKSFFK